MEDMERQKMSSLTGCLILSPYLSSYTPNQQDTFKDDSS